MKKISYENDVYECPYPNAESYECPYPNTEGYETGQDVIFEKNVPDEAVARRRYCMQKIVRPHTLMAAATVTGTSIVSVPFTDSIPLMGIQTKMVMNILSEYGIQTDLADVAKNLTGSTLISYVGRTLASQIIGIIPFAGQVAKSVVNVSVAASITAILGAAVSYICEGYLRYCENNNGAPDLDFLKYFTDARIRDAMKYVGGHKDEFDIDDILKKADKKES
ncbi:MAG: hypothetical protein IJU25_03685 [Lachnospiraceae bacterium]|nr:hypothetical protein [Lachnospiraceae bacterium]